MRKRRRTSTPGAGPPSVTCCSRSWGRESLSGFLLAFIISLDDFIITNFVKGAGVENPADRHLRIGQAGHTAQHHGALDAALAFLDRPRDPILLHRKTGRKHFNLTGETDHEETDHDDRRTGARSRRRSRSGMGASCACSTGFEYMPQELVDKFEAEDRASTSSSTPTTATRPFWPRSRPATLGSYDVGRARRLHVAIMAGEGLLDTIAEGELANRAEYRGAVAQRALRSGPGAFDPLPVGLHQRVGEPRHLYRRHADRSR